MSELNMAQAKEKFTEIESGKYRVLFASFIFGAGRMEDQYGYTLTDQNGNRVGNVIVSLDQDSLHLEIDDDYYNLEGIYLNKLDIAFISEVDELMTKSLLRDDAEYVAIAGFGEDGNVLMPGDYGDIGREDIMKGRWKFGEGFTE